MRTPNPKRETKAVGRLIHSMAGAGESQAVLDSARNTAGVSLPASLERIIDAVGEEEGIAVLDSVRTGMENYQRKVGHAAPPELVETALHQAQNMILDSAGSGNNTATTSGSATTSLHPDAVIVSVLGLLSEAIPFASYLPTDHKSNEARLAIVSHETANAFGGYNAKDNIDGINGGEPYMLAERLVLLTSNGGGGAQNPLTFQITKRIDSFVAGAVSTDNPITPLMRSRTRILVNGLVAAAEAQTAGSGNNGLAGSFSMGGVDYTVSGSVNNAAASGSVVFTPALPAGYRAYVQAFIDYENHDDLTPGVQLKAQTFSLFAASARGYVSTTKDAATQLENELGIFPRDHLLLMLRGQYSRERHLLALRRVALVAPLLADTFDFNFDAQRAAKNRAQIMTDLLPVISGLSQRMAEATQSHGITHLYVTGFLASLFRGLDNSVWESSGLNEIPGIYRMGRLAGRYDVWYSPAQNGVVTESADGDTSQILCVGTSPDVARNPMVLGDAVPPILVPLAVGKDLREGAGFYARSFTELNPYEPSARSAALITVTNIKE